MKINFFILVTFFFVALYSMDSNAGDKKMKDRLEYAVRKGRSSDRDDLKALYSKVASIPGGLVRSADEITDNYIDTILHSALEKGLIFVAEHQGVLIGCVLKYKSDVKILSHVLGEGSILVDPAYQGMGIGTKLYSTLLDEVKEHHPDILRVELKVRVSNPALRLYERLGFQKEGEFKDLIRSVDGHLESVLAMTWFNPEFKNTVKGV
jgi:ribosomal protein S18 acetylase RimI-like enzyme